MKRPLAMWRLLLCAAPLLLAGCLEVEQHPPWRDGAYDGKSDRPHHHTHFHGDRLAWHAALSNRNHLQNEYRRTHP